jgi:RHS repeat-associated protein
MISYRSLRPVLGLMLVLFSVSFIAVSDSWADDCLDCSTSPPPVTPVNASCPALDEAHPDPLLAINPRAESTAKVGKIADAFSVSSTGEAVYHLTLEVPPGRAGMEPHPSLTYDSGAGSGLVGMGFSLGGFSSITRCASNVAQDGRIRGVSYDKGDNFCLDGLRLVKVTHFEAAVTGQCFDEYRTFPDTFRSVRAYCAARGDEDKGPAWFQVLTKPGRILDYGNDRVGPPNGRLMGEDGVIRAWWITQEQDRRSNAIQYLYRNETDPVDGHTVTHVPARINYTAYLGSPAKAATNAVVFDAPDVAIDLNAYVGGMLVSRRPRLDKIRMLGLNDAPVRSYQLVWDANALPGRSRISQIVECAEDNSSKCRPPTRLSWLDQPQQGFERGVDTGIAYPVGPYADIRFKWMMADVTGDGLGDLVTTQVRDGDWSLVDWKVARNLGGNLDSLATWYTSGTPSLPPPANNIGGLTEAEMTFDVVPHDYDQDGIGDLLFSDPAGGEITWMRSLPQGGAFKGLGTGVFIPKPIPANHRVTASTALYADVDGDGVADVIQCNELAAPQGGSHGDWFVRRWSPGGNGAPAGFGAPENIAWLNQRGCNLRRYMHLVDLDGDGKTEIVFPPFGYTREEAQPQSTPQCVGACVYSSLQWYQPAGGGAPDWSLTDTGLPAPDWSIAGGSSRVLFLDVNGDGLPDAVSGGNWLFPGQLVTSINTGKGFQFGLPSLAGYSSDQTEYINFSATLDFDGDGRMDLLLPMKSGACLPYSGKLSCWVVLKSRPSGFGAFDFIPVNIPFSDEIDHTVTRLQQKLIPRVTDVNGDGRADVVMPIDGTFQVFVNDGPRDLLQTVTDGMNPLDPGDDGFLPDVAIEYGTVLDHAKTVGIDPTSSDAESETYLPRTDQLNGCDYPRTCVVGSKRVVSSYTLNNGQNQARAFSMRYRDGRAHRLGRGFLGFGTVMTIDDELNAGRADVYDNVTHDLTFNTFPFAGSLVHSWSWVPEVAGPWNKIAFSYTDWTLVSALSTGQAGAPWTYFTLPVETRTRKSEDLFLSANGTSTMLAFVADHAANPMGDLLDTSEVVSGYDSYGNIMVQQRTTANVDDVRTVERHPYNDANNWLLGEVTKEVACSTALGDTKCRTTVRTYNARGEVETEGRGDPANPETTRNTTFARDDFGNLILVTADDAFGNHRSACITYEKEGIFPYAFSRAVGQISHVAFDAGLGVPTALKDANGLTTVWQHDAFGRTTRETGADGVVTDLGLQRLKNGGPAHTWYAIYPDTTIAGAFRHGQELDSRGRTVRSWAYGPHVAAQNGMNQSTHPLYEEDTTYDLLGRVAQRSKPWMIGDPVGSQLYTQYEYDTLGRTLSVKSPWGYKTRYDYSGNTVVTTMPAAGTMLATSSTTEVDPLGRPITVTDAKLGTTATTYGPFGEPSVVASPAGLFVTVRDAYGRVTQEIDPDRGTTQIHYNGFDEQSQIVDAANRVVAYTYDSLGRRTRRRDNGALSTTWHYDDPVKGYGRLADVTSVGGPTKSYTYDPKGRVSSVALLLSGETFTSQYHHDASGNVDTIDYPQGPGGAQFRVRNEYDEDDNLTGVRDDIDPNHPYFWRLTRVNGVGQTSQEIFGNNAVNQGHALVTERDYFTDTGALKAIRTTAGSTLVQDLAYSYDARLNLATRTDALQLGVNAPKTERFAYDELDRLTSSNLNIVCSPAGSCNDSQVLTYAADGNIATKSDVAGGAKYAYDVANLHPHAVASIGALAYGYDTVGNQTSRPGLTIDYTPFDLPKRYTPTSGDPTPTTFDYDGDQTRVRKTSPGDETVYAGGYERVTHFGMQAEPTEHRYYISSNERVVAVVTRTSQDTKTAYLHVDHLGSTDVVTDGGAGLVFGTVREWRSYDAFGAKRNPIWGVQAPGGSPALTSLGFTSHESEGELGLVNMKGRMFDPKVGRFLSTDPLVSHPGFSQSWNPYSYVLNNPLKFVDPSGFDGDLPGGQIEIVNQRDPIPGVVTETSTTTGPGGIWVTPPGGGTGVTGTGTPPPPGGGVPPGAVTPPPQGDADTPPGDPSPPLDEPANERVVKNIVPDSGGLLNKIAVGAAAGAASFIAGAAAIAPVVKPILDAAAQVLEHGLGPGAAAADRGFPHIGGEPWKAFEPGSSACQTGCEDVARLIQQAIGGDQKVIKGPGRYLGRVMNSAGKFVNPAGDRALGWNFHQVVVKDGKVYDALTGPNGLATSLYKQLWEFGDVLDFGF